MAQFLDKAGVTYLWGKIKDWVSNYAKIVNGKITIGSQEITPLTSHQDISGKQDKIDSSHKLSADLISDGTTNKAYTATEKTKLSGIATGAEVNQNAFSNVKVGSSTIAADGKTDTLELAVASNSVASLTADTTNDKVTIDVDKDLSKYDNGTSGFITSADIPEGAAASNTTPKMDGTAAKGSETAFARGDHVHPTDTSRVEANAAITGATKCKITYDSKGLVTSGADLSASDIPNLSLSKITDVTATAAEVNVLDGITASTAELNIMDGVTASATEINVLDGITATTTELNYVDGVTSAIQTQLNGKVNSSAVGAASGVCPLNASSKIDSTYLPSYVDDVIEAYARSGQTALTQNWLATGSASGTVITPESGKVYILMADSGTYAANSQFRWGGTAYVQLYDGGVSAITTSEIDAIVAS